MWKIWICGKYQFVENVNLWKLWGLWKMWTFWKMWGLWKIWILWKMWILWKIHISDLASFLQKSNLDKNWTFAPVCAFLGWIFYLYIYLVPIFSLVETPWRIRMIWTTKPIQSTFWLINLHYVYSSFPVVGECLFRSTDGRSLSKAIQGHL